MNNNKKQLLPNEVVLKALELSGKMAIASELVINSTIKDLSFNIEKLESSLCDYNNFIFNLCDENFDSS